MPRESKMIEIKKQESIKKATAVKNAVAKLKRNGETLNLSSVSREAKVSKSFIYKNHELYELVDANRIQFTKPAIQSTKTKKKIAEKLREENRLLRERIFTLEKQIDNSSSPSMQEKYQELMDKYNELKISYDAVLKQLNEKIEEEGIKKFPTISARVAKTRN